MHSRDHTLYRQPLQRVASAKELVQCFRYGKVAVADSELVLSEAARAWRFELLREKFCDRQVYRFDRISKPSATPPRSTVGELCEALELLGDERPQLDGSLFRYPHGILNARQLAQHSLLQPGFTRCAGSAMSFVWVGVSAGTFHRDIFNNVLAQISGSKVVTVFPPEASSDIASTNYLELRRPGDLFSEPNLEKFPRLGDSPWFQVELQPGDAVVIPSGAFHSVISQSLNAVSVNCFVLPPLLGNRCLGPHARKVPWLPWWTVNMGIRMSRVAYALFGRPLFRTGAYELM